MPRRLVRSGAVTVSRSYNTAGRGRRSVPNMTATPIPEGYHSLTPNLTVANGLEALDFYAKAFGAEVIRKLVMGSKLMHSELRLGDSIFSVSDPFEEFGLAAPVEGQPLSSSILIYTE